ncbi:MAG: thioredoxin domain-containing protein [Clostridiales bacterium]|nr:thioredoxin domain-containing protein [Clostridiales bacterium]
MKENILVKEKSPYLLQHATNPINWYPWSEKAFSMAKEQDKPVFLSIGYSTCHRCHVMEKESFQDKEIADMLNKHFISIKVDREERPDIDSVYMEVCQALTGSGGWPMTIIMTAEQKPFFAGTYLPKRNALGRIGLYELLEYVSSMWSRDKQKLSESGQRIIEFLAKEEESKERDRERSVPDILDNAFTRFDMAFDEENGGFGGAPKFPTSHNLLFLMDYAVAKENDKAWKMAQKTLIQMYRGGIYDHIGGGFSRYSTDEIWLEPHFEKMLYDNALLINAYATYIENSKNFELNELFSDVITKTIGYLVTELRHPEGAFYCAQDADVDGKEGEYYFLTKKEIYNALDTESADSFCASYDIKDEKSIANLLNNPSYLTASKELDNYRDKLIEFRKSRAKLFTDDKILTAWNALMISALVKAGKVLGRETYIKYAIKAYEFIEKNLTGENGLLYIRWRDGEKKQMGILDDYAFYAKALIDLYSCTFNLDYLERAAEIAHKMYSDFGNGNGLYLYSQNSEQLIIRPKQYHDGAMPSGNSVACDVFNSLYKLTGHEKWQRCIKTQFEAIIPNAERYALGYGYSLMSMVNIAYPKPELIVVTNKDFDIKFLQSLKNVDILVKTSQNKKQLENSAPFTKNYPIAENIAYYCCYKGTCKAPVYSAEEVKELLNSFKKP